MAGTPCSSNGGERKHQNHKLVHIKREIESNEWDPLPTCTSDFHDNKEEYQCNMHMDFTELRNIKTLVLESTLNVNFVLSCRPGSDNVSMQTCFPWNLGDNDTDWDFDHCLIKMEFKDPITKATLVTKCFHVESESGKCKMDDRTHLSQSSEVANFHDPHFSSKAELVPSFTSVENTKRSKFDLVPPMTVEIIIRLHKKEVADVPQPPKSRESSMPVGCGKGHYFLFSGESSATFGPPTLLPASDYSDVCFAVGPDSKLYTAHKCILAAHSVIFKTMFEDKKPEGNEKLEVQLKDVDSSAFEVLLNYCYGSEMMHRFGNVKLVEQVLNIANRFKIRKLTQLCVESLIGSSNSSFNDDTAFTLYKTGRMLGNKGLIFRAIQWMQRNGNAAY